MAGCSRGDKAWDKAEPGRAAETPVGTVKLALEPAQWPLEAVVATNSIALQDRLEVTGDVAVTQASPGPVLSSNAELVLGMDAKVTGSVKADTLVLRERSQVTGDAT